MEASIKKPSRKQQVAKWNRRLGWITFPTLVAGTILYYAPRLGWWDIPRWPGDLFSGLFPLLFFLHSLCSVYLFGFPKFRTNIRIVHIYIGYVVFVFTLASQSLIGVEPWHNITYAVMWLFVLLHVSLSVRFALQRNKKTLRDPQLAFRGR
jgi:hypothetical protein